MHSNEAESPARAGRTTETAGLPADGVLEVRGADSRAFLHRQLSTDTLQIRVGDCHLSSWSDARGRLQAIPHLVAMDEDIFFLILPTSRIRPLCDQLARYVLRDRVELRDASAEWQLRGLAQDTPATPATGVTVRLAGTPARRLQLVPAGEAPGAAGISGDDWRRLGIRAGIPAIHEATVGRFTPQMVNLDLLAAVDFRKGCYPGQEVIARAHYLGRSKRRMFIVRGAGAPPAPGSPLYRADTAAGDGEAAGEIVEAARGDDGDWQATAVLRLAAAETALAVERPDSTPVAVEPPPYPLEPG